MDAIIAIQSTVAARVGKSPDYEFGGDANAGFAALRDKQALSATSSNAIEGDATSPIDVVSSRIAVGLRSGFTAKDSQHLLKILDKSATGGKEPDVTQIMLASHKFQMSSALATAVQTMSSNVKQSIDKLISAN
jgi:Fic family protein